MTNEPLVSVILPIYNPQKEWLKESVESVLDQTYDNIELILVNDGSDEPLESYLSNHIINREDIISIEQKNQGFTSATNKGIANANGEYISPIGQDDIWQERKIEKQINSLASDQGICFTKADIIDHNKNFLHKGGRFPSKYRYEKLKLGNYPIYESSLIDVNLLKKNNLLNEEFDIVSDYDLWFRLWPQTEVTYLDDALVFKRSHKNNTSKTSKKLLEEGEKVRRKYIEDDKILKKSLSRFFRWKGKGFFDSGNTKLARKTWKKSLKQEFNFKTLGLLMISPSPSFYRIVEKSYRALRLL